MFEGVFFFFKRSGVLGGFVLIRTIFFCCTVESLFFFLVLCCMSNVLMPKLIMDNNTITGPGIQNGGVFQNVYPDTLLSRSPDIKL